MSVNITFVELQQIDSEIESAGCKFPSPFVPRFTLIISIIQVALYCFQTDDFVDSFCYSPRRREEFQRFFSYSLLHLNFLHLYANLQSLLLFGYYIEKSQGPWWTAIIYFTGILSGSVGCDAFDRRRRVIGNSAACSSLIYANAADLIVNWKPENLKERRTYILLAHVICDLFSWPIVTYFLKNLTISWSSHLTGGLNGFLGGYISLKLSFKVSNLYILWIIWYLFYIGGIYGLSELLKINCA